MSGLSRTRTIALASSVGLAYICWGLIIALQPPFYPSKAEEKGATPSQYGFVFGIFNLAAFVLSPIFGRYGARIGPKLLYISGAFGQALATIAFGFLEYVDNTIAFLVLSYILRFIQGVSDAAALGAVISILLKLYPNQVTSIISWTEMLFGFGFMVGPTLGSALFTVGGFITPFVSVGSLTLLTAVLLLSIVPNVKMDEKDNTEKSKSLTFAELIKKPSIVLPFVDNFICFCGIGMAESMLEPHLRDQTGATTMEIGVTFLFTGGCYMLATPIVGYVCDKIRYPTLFSISGNIFMAVAFLFIGPVSFLNLEPSIPLVRGCLAIIGLGYAQILVSSYGRSHAAAIRNGYNDDMDTYFLISGMWASSFYCGNFFGPTVSGFFVEELGFRKTTSIFYSLFILILVIDFLELIYRIKSNAKAETEKENTNEIKNEKMAKSEKC